MRKLFLIFSTVVVFSMVLSACGGQQPETPAEEPSPVASEAPPTESTQATPESSPVVELVNPVTAPMELHSTFRYVDGTLLVAMPGGPSKQGSPTLPDNPPHDVVVDDVWAYATKVTNFQYMFCVEVGECTPPDTVDNPVWLDPIHFNDPVVGVTHSQGADYCTWVRGRYATDAEWEKLARGPDGLQFPWGEEPPSCALLNTADCVGKPSMVLNYPDGKSYYDAWDMAGNVYEWVADWYDPKSVINIVGDNPLGPEFGEKRSVRSLGFSRSFFEAEPARRWSLKPEEHKNDLGFRCVVEDPFWWAPFCEAKRIYGVDANGNPIPGGSNSVPCPPAITFGQFCSTNYVPFTTVNPGNPNTTIDNKPPCFEVPAHLGECLQPDYGGESVNFHSSCTVPLPADFVCPMGSSPSADGCSVQGHPGECLAGSTYDPVNQCCSALTANGVNMGCPVGWYDTVAGCAPFPASSGASESVSPVPFAACNPPGGGDDGDDDSTGGDCPPPQHLECDPFGGNCRCVN